MATNRASRHLRQYNVAKALKAAGLVVGFSAFGYFAIEIARHAGPPLNAAAGYALESQMANLEVAAQPQGSQPGAGTAIAAGPTATAAGAPVRDFDYFPDHYVNRATKFEEPIPTF